MTCKNNFKPNLSQEIYVSMKVLRGLVEIIMKRGSVPPRSFSMSVRRLGSPTFPVAIALSVKKCKQSTKRVVPQSGLSDGSCCRVLPAAVPAPVPGRSPSSVVLRPVASTLRPATPVRTPPAIFPLPSIFYFVPVAMATIAVALLSVVIVAIASVWRPPVVHGLLILVLPVPEVMVKFEGAGALGVASVECGRWERGVGRMGVVHGIWRVVAHRL